MAVNIVTKVAIGLTALAAGVDSRPTAVLTEEEKEDKKREAARRLGQDQ